MDNDKKTNKKGTTKKTTTKSTVKNNSNKNKTTTKTVAENKKNTSKAVAEKKTSTKKTESKKVAPKKSEIKEDIEIVEEVDVELEEEIDEENSVALKTSYFVILICAILVIIGGVAIAINASKESTFNTITVNDIATVSDGTTAVIYLAREGCSWCTIYTPVIQALQENYIFDVYYIDMAAIIDYSENSVTDSSAFVALRDIEAVDDYADFMTSNVGSTPVLLLVKDGVLQSAMAGYLDSDELESYLKENGIIE